MRAKNFELVAAVGLAFASNWLTIPLHGVLAGLQPTPARTWLAIGTLFILSAVALTLATRDSFAKKPRDFREALLLASRIKLPWAFVVAVALTIVILQLGFDTIIDIWSDCTSPGAHCKFALYEAISLVLFVGCIGLLHRARLPRFADRVKTAKGAPAPRKPALLWFLSVHRIASLDAARRHFPSLTLRDLDRDIDVLERDSTHWDLEQLLRALRHHARDGILRRLYVAASIESKNRLRLLLELVRSYSALDSVKIFYVQDRGERIAIELTEATLGDIVRRGGIDFEDVNAALTTIQRAASHWGADHEFVVDITGGQKPNTAAAMLFTVERDARAEYVQTGNRKEVLTFDIVMERAPSI